MFALRQHLYEGRSPSGLRSGLHGARGIPSPVWGFLLVEAGSAGLLLGMGMGWDAATASPTLEHPCALCSMEKNGSGFALPSALLLRSFGNLTGKGKLHHV